jgi:hypothetical protein
MATAEAIAAAYPRTGALACASPPPRWPKTMITPAKPTSVRTSDVQVMCNDAPSPRRSSDDLRLVTPSGFTASRIENEDSPFAYEPRPLGPGQCAPRAISAPGRAADALLALFEVPQDAAARRPLDFGVESVDGSVRRVRVVDVGE